MRNLAAGMVALVAVSLIGWALLQFGAATRGVGVERDIWGSIPVTVFRPSSGSAARRPTVVIAHGFAGSQQLMQPFAVTLARNGYLAVTFDFPGHGGNPVPLPGSLREHDALLASLLGAIESTVAGVRTLPGADGRVALIGHSMASDLVVRHAQAHPETVATVGVSLVYGGADKVAPRNLLAIYGALEPAMLQTFGRAMIAGPVAQTPGAADTPGAPTSPDAVQPERTYGRFDDGSARRLTLAPGAEHISVLYNRATLRETLDWLDQSFTGAPVALPGSGFIDARGPAIGALLLGIVGLTWPLSLAMRRLLAPRAWRDAIIEYVPWQPASIRIAPWLAVTLGPAIATPLLLRMVPTSFLPILLGDYLLLHFALYGLLTAAGIGWLVRRQTISLPPPRMPGLPALLATVAVLLWSTLAIGLPVDRWMFNLAPAPGRGVLIVMMLTGTLAWFCADEWLTRHRQAPRLAYAFTKFCFLLSLAIAVGLDLSRLFFLIIIIPAILVMFIVYGLFSRWSFRATGSPWPAAIANACVFAWGIAVTFPAIQR